MKELILMRHAKADMYSSDFQRPLSEQGAKSAALMGKEILKRSMVPELIVASSAIRAKQTAEYFAVSAGFAKKIQYSEAIYYANNCEDLLDIIYETDSKVQRLMIIGHNPVLEYLASLLIVDNKKHIDMPPATFVYLRAEIENWSQLSINTCILKDYITIKSLEI